MTIRHGKQLSSNLSEPNEPLPKLKISFFIPEIDGLVIVCLVFTQLLKNTKRTSIR